jgi:hypothetical protein
VYAALWRFLPGPVWTKTLQCLVLALLFCLALLYWVFPAVEPHLPFDRIIIGES